MRHLLPVLAAVTACGSIAGAAVAEDPDVSSLRSDERVVFFTTDAYRTDDERAWLIPIHAWVFEPETTRVRKALFARVLEEKYGLRATAETASTFDARVRLFVVDNEGDKQIAIRLGETTYTLPPTAPNGHATTHVQLDADIAARHAQGGVLAYSAVLPEGDDRVFTGYVNLVEPDGISVISDIDDTVKVTGVTDRRMMFDRTFFRDFAPAPGMAALYARWARQGAAFHFVSSSPWQMYEPLDTFLTTSRFPARSLSLKLVRVKDRSIADLFRKGTETKPRQIEPILRRFPERRFVLVGDSGEQDPEVYAALMRAHPDRVVRIYIRNVDRSSRDDLRYRTVFGSIDPDRWVLFDDPADLTLP